MGTNDIDFCHNPLLELHCGVQPYSNNKINPFPNNPWF